MANKPRDRQEHGQDPTGASGDEDSREERRPDPQAGIDREVGDLEDPDAEDDGALPGRAGGGLAGG